MVLTLSTIYEFLKHKELRIITRYGVLFKDRLYTWTDMKKWGWKGNILYIDIKKNIKFFGCAYDYLEINVPEEKILLINEVFEKYRT